MFNKIAFIIDNSLILNLNLMLALTMVFLSSYPITSLIFSIKAVILLFGAVFTPDSAMPHTKQSKGLQSGELGGQISYYQTPRRFSLSQSLVFMMLQVGVLSCADFKLFWSIHGLTKAFMTTRNPLVFTLWPLEKMCRGMASPRQIRCQGPSRKQKLGGHEKGDFCGVTIQPFDVFPIKFLMSF